MIVNRNKQTTSELASVGGWILNLVDKKGETIRFKEPVLIMEGGRAKFTNRAEIIITYNYGGFFHHAFKDRGNGIRTLRGMTGSQSVILLNEIIAMMAGGLTDIDYLKPTSGNARNALEQVRYLAALCPDGIWQCTL